MRGCCLGMKGTTEGLPFDADALVFKVRGKIFALTSFSAWEKGEPTVNLKCEPEKALVLRGKYEAVRPGYHMNKKHWNTVRIDTGELSDAQVFTWVAESYQLVVKNLPKKVQAQLAGAEKG